LIRRRRWIQPEFFTSEDVLALPRDVRLTFIGLWLYADDYGRERTNPALIKADVWPVEADITPDVVEEHLLLLAERSMISLYAVDGREYFQLTGWDRHQPVDKPSRSNVPPPPAPSAAPPQVEPSRGPRDPSPTPLATEGGERDEGEGESERDGCKGEPDGEHEGVAALPPTDPAHDRSQHPPSPFCKRHPGGTSKACKDCGNARMAFKHWQATQMIDDDSEETP
jgi:hypothetical protein